ncbi:MAG TPA: hypothetical protein VF407_01135 [Polyangiaceae bacterium]
MNEDDPKKSESPPASLRTRSSSSLPAAAPPAPRSTARMIPRVTVRLSAVDFDVVNAARRILESSLGVVPGDRVLVLLDVERADMASVMIEVAQSLGAVANVFVLEEFGGRPQTELPGPVLDALHTAQASILLISSHDAETPLRQELLSYVADNRLRHAHMPGVSRSSVIVGFSADPQRVADATRAVRMRMRPSSRLHLRSTSGSDLVVFFAPQHRWVEHVGTIRPGRWENLPSGALVTAAGEVNGVFVADASLGSEHGSAAGVLEGKPVRFDIENGVCKGVRCNDLTLQRAIEEVLRRERDLDRVGLVLLGTNIGIARPTGEAVCDQNMPGLHLGFGATFPDQTGATWTSRGQLIATSASGDVDLDGAPLLRSGRYIVG